MILIYLMSHHRYSTKGDRTCQLFFLMNRTLLPRISNLENSYYFLYLLSSLALVSSTFMLPSRQAMVPTKNVWLSLSFTYTSLPSILFRKSPGLFRLPLSIDLL